MKSLYNKHFNKMAFVIGAGPSLRFINNDDIKDYVTITVNSGILKLPECDYFLSDDIGAHWWNYWHDTAPKSNCIKLLYEDKLKRFADHFDPKQVVYFKHKEWFTPPNKFYLPEGLTMTKDPTLPIIGARTSVASAVHVAYIMGCNPIVLLGCDCCYGPENCRYFWQYPGFKKAYRINNEPVFCETNGMKISSKMVDYHCVEFIHYWNKFAKINKGKCNIISASDGLLKCFPKMEIKDILKEYGKNKK